MIFKAKIMGIVKARHQETNTEFLDVAFVILADENEVAERKAAFEISATREAIVEEIAKQVQAYAGEEQQKLVQAPLDEMDNNITQLADELMDQEVGEFVVDMAE